MLALVPNIPLDLLQLRSLLSDKDDLALVWPAARFPFDQEQWREILSMRLGNRSYVTANEGEKMGHGALLETDESGVLSDSYLFIRRDMQGRGLERTLLVLLEGEARKSGAQG